MHFLFILHFNVCLPSVLHSHQPFLSPKSSYLEEHSSILEVNVMYLFGMRLFVMYLCLSIARKVLSGVCLLERNKYALMQFCMGE